MKNIGFALAGLLAGLVLYSCGNDDDDGGIPVRDRNEVYAEDLVELQAYLETHFYNYEEFASNPQGEGFEIEFDTIAGNNVDKRPLMQDVVSRTIRRDDIDYTYYVLKVRQGGGAGQPAFADSTLVTYRGQLLNGNNFDQSTNPIWFDLTNTVTGFSLGLTDFNESSASSANGDGTFTFTDSGVGAVFMPSGIGYFSSAIPGIPTYSPLIFTFQLYKSETTDHDGDGIFSKFEDLDGDKSVTSPNNADNTDQDRSRTRILYNYVDIDDDNDGVPTIFENADPNGDGDPSDAEDIDNDGIPDYLDEDSVNIDLDGDGIQNRFEAPDPNGNGNPADARDTDNDGVPDYLDPDDDGDGILTINEMADPNNNGNPSDAVDTNGNGIPDYLDPNS
ncbi:FKBP-type peptidyl-prolyl cis-trans isomerase [Nonlabens xiamenensis]|uniref:FKBP-type peptidyl-prolyl cis-trans isomerase n=1 Tax=Nonlabens xiamenensis TaxID=2341043 RepID=UPI000F61409F|nr:peptidylprolyl isomerase [Nonlabens xiamenensis]